MTPLRDYYAREPALAAIGEGPARTAAIRVVTGFIDGARCARDHAGPDLPDHLDRLHAAAYEGAGLVTATPPTHAAHDLGTARANHRAHTDHAHAPDRPAFTELLKTRPHHALLLCIGHGWSRALRDLPPAQGPPAADPQARWWSVDGHGFAVGLLRPRHALTPAALLPRSAADRALFDRGVGRSLWYRHAGDVPAIAHMIGRLGARAPDLWCGVGIAAIFSGGLALLDPPARRDLLRRGGDPLRHGAAIGGTSAILHGPDFDLGPLHDLDVDPIARSLPDTADYLEWRRALADALA